ncbi:hypothetical protein ABZP36_026930 [Zizania latifolia]
MAHGSGARAAVGDTDADGGPTRHSAFLPLGLSWVPPTTLAAPPRYITPCASRPVSPTAQRREAPPPTRAARTERPLRRGRAAPAPQPVTSCRCRSLWQLRVRILWDPSPTGSADAVRT